MSENEEHKPPVPTDQPKRHSPLRGAFQHLRNVGREMFSVALGKWLAKPEDAASSPLADASGSGDDKLEQRVTVLHGMAEKLRGAADSYIAAKLDEIEARVNVKLNHIEHRIDDKIVELHKQLAEMRDRELRHRLRMLKITLIFTVLVALLSLGYKWILQYWISP